MKGLASTICDFESDKHLYVKLSLSTTSGTLAETGVHSDGYTIFVAR